MCGVVEPESMRMLIREIEVLPRRSAHSQLRAFVSTLNPTSLTDDVESIKVCRAVCILVWLR